MVLLCHNHESGRTLRLRTTCVIHIYIYVLYGYKCFMFKRSWMLCMFFKNVYVTAYIYISDYRKYTLKIAWCICVYIVHLPCIYIYIIHVLDCWTSYIICDVYMLYCVNAHANAIVFFFTYIYMNIHKYIMYVYMYMYTNVFSIYIWILLSIIICICMCIHKRYELIVCIQLL